MKKAIFLFTLVAVCFANMNKNVEFRSEYLQISEIFTAKENSNYQTINYKDFPTSSNISEPRLPIITKYYIISENEIYCLNENISFELFTDLATSKHNPILQRSENMQYVYDEALKSIVENSEDIDQYQIKPLSPLDKKNNLTPSFDYEYIIITANSLIQTFDNFIEWKKRKGINIGITSIESVLNSYSIDLASFIEDDAGALRQYIQDAYECGCTYILLRGDDTIIPIKYGNYTLENTVIPSGIHI